MDSLLSGDQLFSNYEKQVFEEKKIARHLLETIAEKEKQII